MSALRLRAAWLCCCSWLPAVLGLVRDLDLAALQPQSRLERVEGAVVRSVLTAAEDIVASLDARRGKIFFLFLANDAVHTEDVWLRFFEGAQLGHDFEVLLHCSDLEGCQQNVQNKTVFRTIPTVASQWCEDLVSPMDALLTAAVALSSEDDADKFVFVSDSTVPVKSFRHIRQRLIVDEKKLSNFCIDEPQFWALDYESEGMSYVVKHHQWMTLSRAHAERLVTQRAVDRQLLGDLVASQHLGLPWVGVALRRLTDAAGPFKSHVNGCLDEYLYFKLLFGSWPNKTQTELPLEGVSGPPLLLEADGLQGRCDTFACFGHEPGNFSSLLADLRNAADTVVEEAPKGLIFGRSLHPIRFQQLSPSSMRALRTSPFLFARKVDNRTTFAGGGSLVEAFVEHIFAADSEDKVG
eukprot:TRINITY_DN20856_c0_g4_i1.p1 TRINITY_DN20856_c0_g4~~TRINITY_DN20856_c0_g4_i1.p1  ORF type:complete len:410 (-),score=86.59 TRINITY_DN20856_c0_g4_i1:95-1324(-)